MNTFNEGLFDSIEVDDPTKKSGQKFLFEISNVELLADMSAIQIHWLCSSTESINKEVEKALDVKLRAQIRSRLIEDRVINYVPRIVFLRDPSRVIFEKLDEYLVKIDLEKNSAQNDNQNEDTKGKMLGVEFRNHFDWSFK